MVLRKQRGRLLLTALCSALVCLVRANTATASTFLAQKKIVASQWMSILTGRASLLLALLGETDSTLPATARVDQDVCLWSTDRMTFRAMRPISLGCLTRPKIDTEATPTRVWRPRCQIGRYQFVATPTMRGLRLRMRIFDNPHERRALLAPRVLGLSVAGRTEGLKIRHGVRVLPRMEAARGRLVVGVERQISASAALAFVSGAFDDGFANVLPIVPIVPGVAAAPLMRVFSAFVGAPEFVKADGRTKSDAPVALEATAINPRHHRSDGPAPFANDLDRRHRSSVVLTAMGVRCAGLRAELSTGGVEAEMSPTIVTRTSLWQRSLLGVAEGRGARARTKLSGARVVRVGARDGVLAPPTGKCRLGGFRREPAGVVRLSLSMLQRTAGGCGCSASARTVFPIGGLAGTQSHDDAAGTARNLNTQSVLGAWTHSYHSIMAPTSIAPGEVN